MLRRLARHRQRYALGRRSEFRRLFVEGRVREEACEIGAEQRRAAAPVQAAAAVRPVHIFGAAAGNAGNGERSEEHTSELQSLMRISYAVFCLKKKKNILSYSIEQIITRTLQL